MQWSAAKARAPHPRGGGAGRAAGQAAGRTRPMARSKPVARAAVLLAFVVLVASCLGAAAAKGTGWDGQCGGCKKKKGKFDDRCFYDPAANFCQDVGPNVCRGIQKRHGGSAAGARRRNASSTTA